MTKKTMRRGLWGVLAMLLLCLALGTVCARPAHADQDAARTVSVAFVGPDEEWDRVDGVTLQAGDTAWSATMAALERSRLFYTTGLPTSATMLAALSQGMDDTWYAFDPATGSGWHLYVNDERVSGQAAKREVHDGDQLVWRYESGTHDVSVSVVGPGGTGHDFWVKPMRVRVGFDQSVWDASLVAFTQRGYARGRLLSYTQRDDGTVTLDSLAALGENGLTGESWQVFVNGALQTDAAHTIAAEGDSICWYYAGHGENTLPLFVVQGGAASPVPASTVRVEGRVVQAWALPAMGDDGAPAPVEASSGLRLTGDAGLPALLFAKSPAMSALARIQQQDMWERSLARVLDDTVRSGEGGNAARGASGGVYYLDGSDALVKLEEQER